MERTHSIMFVCHGNICRSPMAEFLLKDMIKKEGLADKFVIASAGTSREEIGNPVHQGTRKKLAQDHISATPKDIFRPRHTLFTATTTGATRRAPSMSTLIRL